MNCPLCLNKNSEIYYADDKRDYWQCHNCFLVFVLPERYLSPQAEKLIYDKHQNDPHDLGYRKFLNKLVVPLLEKLKAGENGLDFGCGPGPTISEMLADRGFKVENYDIFYDYHPDLLKQKYGFITCTEVIEHLHFPHQELNTLFACLKTFGALGIMTKRVLNKSRFANWHYKNDPTHVCFYSTETFEYIAKTWNCRLDIINSDTVMLTKLNSTTINRGTLK